jgi:hypothetical protein
VFHQVYISEILSSFEQPLHGILLFLLPHSHFKVMFAEKLRVCYRQQLPFLTNTKIRHFSGTVCPRERF